MTIPTTNDFEKKKLYQFKLKIYKINYYFNTVKWTLFRKIGVDEYDK